MFALSLLLSSTFLAQAQPPAQTGVYTAQLDTFGTVEINGNEIKIMLDGGGVGGPLDGLDSVSYHIHEMWMPTNASDRWGLNPTECGPSVTGGHWDPTFACGAASGADDQCNAECIPKGEGYDCTTASYESQWTNCEVGDLSGKFGVIALTNGTGDVTAQDNFLLPVPTDLSIVFHAPDGSRVLCGALTVNPQGSAVPQEAHSAGKLYGNLGFASITLDYDVVPTSVQVTFDASNTDNSDALAQLVDECKSEDSELSYHIHEMWGHDNAQAAMGADLCGATYTGGHIDPTYACGPASGNPKCAAEYDTPCNWATYDCTPTTYMQSPLACEIGDLSGKMGKLTVRADGSAEVTQTDEYLPVITALNGLSVVFHCPGGTRAFCVQLGTDPNVITPALAPSPSPSAMPDASPDASPSVAASSSPNDDGNSAVSNGASAWGAFMAFGLGLFLHAF